MTDSRKEFEQWAQQRWGSEAYRHVSDTSGEWDAWRSSRSADEALMREAEICVECAEIWARGSEGHARLVFILEKLRARLEGTT